MKKIIIRILIISFITIPLLCCDKTNEIGPIPTPAISFNDGILNLLQKEPNKLIDQYYAIDDNTLLSDSFVRTTQMVRLTYLTSSNDTIEYLFFRNKLSSILIKSPKQIYENVINEFNNNDTIIKKIHDNQYKRNDDYIITIKRYDNGTDFVYLNDIDNEITDYLQNQLEEDMDFLKESGVLVLTKITLGLIGNAAGVRILPNHMQKGNKHKYYNDFLWLF